MGDAHGEPLLTYRDVASRWRDYFCEQEDGSRISAKELFSRSPGGLNHSEDGPAWNDLPSLKQIELYYRQTKSGKGYFIDGVPGVISG